MSKKTTAIFGASPNPQRYSYLSTEMLQSYGHPVVPLGLREGKIGDAAIITEWPEAIDDLDTITLYVGPKHQPEHYDYLLGLRPKRIIFNPGTENPEFKQRIEAEGIEAVTACTLVMLRTEQYA
jgi:hypothetical protein